MSGMCGIVGVDVRAGDSRRWTPIMYERSLALLQKLYDAFDESGDDEEEQSDEDDHDPRQGVDKLGALG